MTTVNELSRRLNKIETALSPLIASDPEMVVNVQDRAFLLYWPRREGYRIEKLSPREYEQWRRSEKLNEN